MSFTRNKKHRGFKLHHCDTANGERVFDSADMNGDEELDGKDVILLKRKVETKR